MSVRTEQPSVAAYSSTWRVWANRDSISRRNRARTSLSLLAWAGPPSGLEPGHAQQQRGELVAQHPERDALAGDDAVVVDLELADAIDDGLAVLAARLPVRRPVQRPR